MAGGMKVSQCEIGLQFCVLCHFVTLLRTYHASLVLAKKVTSRSSADFDE